MAEEGVLKKGSLFHWHRWASHRTGGYPSGEAADREWALPTLLQFYRVAQGKSKERGFADATVLCPLSRHLLLAAMVSPTGFFNTKVNCEPPGPCFFRAVSRQSSQINGKLHALSAGEKELRYEFFLSWNAGSMATSQFTPSDILAP